jgi:hypothetical protein
VVGLINTIETLADNIAYSHNWIHYASARLIGIQISTENKDWINSAWPIWKNVVVYTAPNLFGLLWVLGAFVGFNELYYWHFMRSLFAAFFDLGFAWLGICSLDFFSLIYFLLTGEWIVIEIKNNRRCSYA